jgi:1-acyl-sn-glycerol-3-phosphate acyltransferase
MNFLRSAAFNAYFFGVTFILTLVPASIVRFVAPGRVLDVARLWARLILGGLRVICGIRLEVHGV